MFLGWWIGKDYSSIESREWTQTRRKRQQTPGYGRIIITIENTRTEEEGLIVWVRGDEEDILGGAECAGDETGIVGEVVGQEMVEE